MEWLKIAATMLGVCTPVIMYLLNAIRTELKELRCDLHHSAMTIMELKTEIKNLPCKKGKSCNAE
jgi:hypothetical protein